MRKWESIVFGKFVEGKLGGVHIVANNGRHLLVVLSHNSVGVFPHIWQTLPAVILSQRLVVLILQVEHKASERASQDLWYIILWRLVKIAL